MSTLIEVKNLTFGYRREPILRDISLYIKKGELVSIIGPNGSGKSTLLKCIYGILKPWKGVIKLNGADIGKISKLEFRKIVSYLPQETIPPPSLMTAYEFILLGRLQYLTGKLKVDKEDLDSINEVIELLDIKQYVTRYMNELSGGEKQLIYLAQALVKKPKLLLLDEPLNHLDIKNQFQVLKILKDLTRKINLSIIIVMHDINQAARFSDRMYLISNGEVICEGIPEEVLQPEILEKTYGIKFRLIYDINIPQVIPTG